MLAVHVHGQELKGFYSSKYKEAFYMSHSTVTEHEHLQHSELARHKDM